METVLRAIAIYLFLLLVFRISGKRTLSQMHPFDMVLLLIIGDSVSQGLMGDDFSITTALLLVTTLVLMELLLSFIKQKSKLADRWLDDVPMIVVEDGKPLPDRMKRARVDDSEVLEAARILHGLENMQQVKYAVLERDGSISIIPRKSP
ncbi:YetF domain-containing protein [Lysobacter sp. F6437]|uniref:YetF domain-containing protein n=1 Tax=Lysobacter sp. F6437 TaxID=3459296 RepID=UPI00403E0B5C